MNATLALVSPRRATVSPSWRRWFDASVTEGVTVTEGDRLFTREAEVHQPGRNSATAGWGQAYHGQMPIFDNIVISSKNMIVSSSAEALYEASRLIDVNSNIPATRPYYGRSANSTAASLCSVVLSWGGSAQSDFFQMWSGQSASPASTDVYIPSTPTSTLAAELQELRGLSEGWDGEAAAAPIPGAINDALSFVRAAEDLSARLEPTVHVDGSVILEVGDGSEGSLRFRGDHTITYAIRGFAPGVARFDGKTVPKEILATLAAVS
jgi:hypothetical protein